MLLVFKHYLIIHFRNDKKKVLKMRSYTNYLICFIFIEKDRNQKKYKNIQ